jgi:predicted transcriptional regulator
MGSIMKKELKIKAKKLRAEGYSVKEIHEILRVSKSTVSLWVKDVVLSEKAQNRINKNYSNGQLASMATIKEKTNQKNILADNFAKDVLIKTNLSKDESLLFCAMLYQCEGSKTIKDSVTFTNSDPSLIRTFLNLFRQSFNLDENKFRVLMHLHNYHDEKLQKEYWSKITGIPIKQFLKTYNKKSTGLYKKEGYQGCIQIRYKDVSIGRKIHAVAKIFMERYK